jgi:hypothetical protein
LDHTAAIEGACILKASISLRNSAYSTHTVRALRNALITRHLSRLNAGIVLARFLPLSRGEVYRS